MCLLASEESLSCAANTTFGPQKTADILNYPQRQRATQKRNNAYLDLLEEKKDPRSTPFVIARNLSAASVIASIANVSVRFGSKQRGTRVKDLVKKMERVKGREGVINKKVDLFGLCGGASAPVAPTLPTGRPDF